MYRYLYTYVCVYIYVYLVLTYKHYIIIFLYDIAIYFNSISSVLKKLYI